MSDYGARFAERINGRVDRSIHRTYGQARKELKEKLAQFQQHHLARDLYMQSQLEAGKITKEYYQNWLMGQVFQDQQWKAKIRQMSDVMLNHSKVAAGIVRQNKYAVFAENYNFLAYIAQQKTGISFQAYSTQAVARLIKDKPQVLPEWRINEEKDYEWNYKKVNNIVRQGIIQGEDISQITDRLCNDLVTANENKMRNFARTAITGAQNAGRQEQMNQAAEMGLKVKKQWIATMDNRTRDAHREMDGDTVDYDASFSNEIGEIRFPGDPLADPANVYNCRCTMVTVYPEYETKGRNWRDSITIDGQRYADWKRGSKKRED